MFLLVVYCVNTLDGTCTIWIRSIGVLFLCDYLHVEIMVQTWTALEGEVANVQKGAFDCRIFVSMFEHGYIYMCVCHESFGFWTDKVRRSMRQPNSLRGGLYRYYPCIETKGWCQNLLSFHTDTHHQRHVLRAHAMLIDAAAMYHHQCCCVAQPSPIQSSFVIPNCHPHFTGNPLGHPKLRKNHGVSAGSRALEASGGFSGSPGLFLQPGRHDTGLGRPGAGKDDVKGSEEWSPWRRNHWRGHDMTWNFCLPLKPARCKKWGWHNPGS